ncbi:LysR family transcriptional regulator [Bosea sp. (in: a-proteobacteria)]|uniref:LysR family transcriptional regulator n=1 Tax=Bosea sp. (in: a-proteobacteria) TaxID=1871050 RepID=UPI001AD2C271|nr:LysR family transcriptional regulator [Bosea sp. (in: a-proteobacteria)]MBN9443941.1 LysR family transcriptional regulator [Bosea sp. (in: a-proteobacteria)]
MKLGSLRAIDAFVRLGGTGEAAQGLGISQSAVIKTLRQAEEELDLSLATTAQGRLVPTPEAHSLVRQAQPLFGALRRARHEADMIRVGMANRLRVATVPGLAHSILPPAITRTRQALDQSAAVEIMFDHVREHLATGEADLGISYGPMRADDIADVALGQSPLVCVLSRDHPLARRLELIRGDIEGERLISYGPDGVSASDSFQEALTSAGLSERIAITVRHTDTACHLAREGVGIALVDGFVISSNLVEGLAVLPLEQSPLVTAYAHHRRHSPLDRAARLLLAQLQERSGP